MKAILKYDLPEEQDLFLSAALSSELVSALWEISQYLRGEVKYKERAEWDDAEKIKDKFYEILGDNNIDLDKLLI